MMPEKVDKMLSEYKLCLGRCKYLSALLVELKAEAASWSDHLAEDMASIGSQVMNGMPHGSALSKPTERIGLMLAENYCPEGLSELQRQIAEYEKELKEKQVIVSFVEAWLEGLTEKERLIIDLQVINGAYWREVILEYSKRFGDEYTRAGLKKIKDRALEKIYEMAI